MTTTKPGDLLRIQARNLIISPKNQRTRTRTRIREFAASLAAHGQLKNIVVIEHVSRKKNAPTHEVIDGGHRTEGAWLAIREGKLPEDFELLCLLDSADRAEEISAAANMHEPMHPADEFTAFRHMIDGGSGVEEVAARFGVTPLTVQRRLKLANVSPRLVQGYRDGELSLEQLMALAITDEHKTQEKLWNQVKDRGNWEKTPEALRRALVKSGSINAATDKRARFVGLDAYEAAGGPVVRDLFSNGGGFIGDEALLQRLAEEKLEAAAEDLRAKGWAWVKTADQWTYSDEAAYSKSQPKKRALTEEEADMLATLREQAEALDKKIDALDVEDEALDAELASLEAQIEAIESLQHVFTDRQKAKAGAVLTIDHGGQLKVVRGLIKREDGNKPKKTAADETNSNGAGQGAPTPEEVERSLSERMVTTLTAHRTAALQAVVANRPDVADALLLATMVPQVLFAAEDRYRYSYSSVAKISLTNNRGVGRQGTDDLEGSRAWLSLQERIDYWQARLPAEEDGKPADLFAWCMGLDLADRDDLRGLCVALTLNTLEHREDCAGHKHAHQLAAAVDLDMADWWQATAESYLAGVPKSRRIEAVREAVGEEAADTIASMKKDDMIAAAELRLDGRRWLPAILRRPGKPAVSAAEPATPAAEPAATSGSVVPIAAVRYRDAAGNAWTGRGKRPKWVEAALASGKTLDDLLVANREEIAA